VAHNNLRYIDEVFYFPFDFAFIVRRTLRLVRPRIFIMMETELWPNLLRACRAAGVKTLLVNGRISSRSYPRYKLARPFFKHVLANVDRFCMQSEESARRIIDMGADAALVTVTGSLKFDSLEGPESIAAADRGRNRVLRYFRLPPDRPVVIAASTLKGEEEPLLDAFHRVRAIRPNALLIIAPRKPERFDDVEALARRTGLNVARRSELRVDAEPRHDIVILDSIGELAQLFQVATVVFVGGSLVDAGGHNILEPAVFGKPIIFGPHMQNFAEIARAFLDNGAGIEVKNGRELETMILDLLADPVRRASLGAAARALVEANRGARGRSLEAIAQLLQPERQANVRMFRVK
jgi:3-deoxy-D-manno-octulosonic-acid transferase